MATGLKIPQSSFRPDEGEHFVQFYEDDDYLMTSLSAYIGAALGAGESAVVIAEKSRREALESRLKDQGIDVLGVKARRQFVSLDAQATVDKFMRHGMPDEALFKGTVGSVVSWSLQGGRPLRAFGEMVALLWKAGNGPAALALEKFWNNLARDHAFTLFCAYPMKGFSTSADTEFFTHVCEEHGRVLPAESYPARATDGGDLREVALLQQRAAALERERIDRERAEASQCHLAAIVESSEDAIVSKDLNGIIMSWNKGAERIFGYAAEEIIGRPVSVLIPPQRDNEEPEILSRIRRGERVEHYETFRIRKDGTTVPISLTISPIRDSKGRITGASKIARDITQRKRDELALKFTRDQLTRGKEELERRVEERSASLRSAVEQMEEFSYTVSHDLRAPLRGMQTYARALMEDYSGALDEEGRRYLSRISENAARLDRMILDVLTFSRVAREEIRPQRISLDRLVHEIAQTYPGMQPPHAEIRIETLQDVMGHQSSLTQAVSNLLNNAVKFAPEGVTPKVHVRTERKNGDVRLWIEDNGIGIDPRHQGKLFGMFERLHPHLKYEGSGVGLAIVRKAVERMGGEVGVESDGRTGSRFWIQLKVAEEQ
jgi:PAS domain S-box-containing protein